jgi:RimJ/RimL family protein N-acetyltransferase
MPNFGQIRLETARLILRPLASDDAASLFAIYSDPQVMRYWSTPPWDCLEVAVATIAADLQSMAEGVHVRLAIVARSTHDLIGTCSLFNIHASSRRAELGYCLAREAWGRGYMHEALLALIGFGFSSLGLHRLEADIDPRNEASARSLERLGFVKEGHLRERWIVNGEVSDSGLYGLLRRDWDPARRGDPTRSPASD